MTDGRLTYPKGSSTNGGDSNGGDSSTNDGSSDSGSTASGADGDDAEYTNELGETEYHYMTREEQTETNKDIMMLLIALIAVIVIGVVVIVSVLCYYKSKKDKEFRVKDPHAQDQSRGDHKAIPKVGLSQTVPADSSMVSNANYDASA